MTVTSVTIYGVNYWPEPTGIGPYTTELAEYLAQQGIEVNVVTTFPHYPQWRVSDPDRRRWRRYETIRGVHLTRLWSRMPKPMTGLQRMIFELSYLVSAILHGPGDAQVVVGVIPGLGSGIVAVILGRLRGRRVVIVVQDLVGQGLKQSGISAARWLGKLAFSAEGFAIRRASTVIAISEAFLNPLESHGVRRERIVVLPNWNRLPTMDTERRPPSSQPLILHAGSMGLKQGLDQVVEAARVAARRGLPYRFMLVGDGSERRRLQELAAGLPNVEFRDPVSEKDFPSLLVSADILLLTQAPSNVDMSFPSKLISYFSAGRPVLASVPKDGSVAVFLRQTGAGMVAEPNAPDALLAAIDRILKQNEFREELVSAARHIVEDQWSRCSVIERWSTEVLRCGA